MENENKTKKGNKNPYAFWIIIALILLFATLPFHYVPSALMVFPKDNLTFSNTFIMQGDIDKLVERYNNADFFERNAMNNEPLVRKLKEKGIISDETSNENKKGDSIKLNLINKDEEINNSLDQKDRIFKSSHYQNSNEDEFLKLAYNSDYSIKDVSYYTSKNQKPIILKFTFHDKEIYPTITTKFPLSSDTYTLTIFRNEIQSLKNPNDEPKRFREIEANSN